MQNVDPTFLILAAVFAIVSIDGYFYRRHLRAANRAAAQLDRATCLTHRRSMYRSRSLSAWLTRLSSPGYLELAYGEALDDAWQHAEAIEVLKKGLARARKPAMQRILRIAIAHASARMGDDGGVNEQVGALLGNKQQGASLSDIELTHILGSLVIIGRVEEAEQIADEILAQKNVDLRPSLFSALLLTYHVRGRFSDVIRLFTSEASGRGRADGSGSPDDDLGIAALLKSADRASMFSAAMATLAAAHEAGQLGVFDKVAGALAQYAFDRPNEQIQVHGALAWRVAHDGKRDEVAALVAAMDRIVQERPDDVMVAEHRRSFLFESYHALGDYEQALRFSRPDPRIANMRFVSSQALALRAKCLAALGRTAEAEAEAAEAGRLAPGAFWCEPGYKEYVEAAEAMDADPVDEDVVVEVVARPVGAMTEASLSPVARVASGLCWWIWGLAIFAFVPLLGIVPGLGILTLATILLFVKRKLPHNRRVAIAGLAIGTVAVGISTALFMCIVGPDVDPVPYVNGVTIQTFDAETAEYDPDEKMSFGYGVALLCVLLVSLTLHEVGHALAAYWSGDPTAKDQGRITLNPIRHLSLFGSVILPLVLYLMPGDGFIGWAKPVPVNPMRYRKWRAGSMAVGLAGVAMNFLLACLSTSLIAVILMIYVRVHPGICITNFHMPFSQVMSSVAVGDQGAEIILSVLKASIWINAFLVVFNLMPVPPLDGFGLLRVVLPKSWAGGLGKLLNLGMIPLLVLVAIGGLQFLLMPAVIIAEVLLAMLYSFASAL